MAKPVVKITATTMAGIKETTEITVIIAILVTKVGMATITVGITETMVIMQTLVTKVGMVTIMAGIKEITEITVKTAAIRNLAGIISLSGTIWRPTLSSI